MRVFNGVDTEYLLTNLGWVRMMDSKKYKYKEVRLVYFIVIIWFSFYCTKESVMNYFILNLIYFK